MPGDTANVGALVKGAPYADRSLVSHAELLAAYADGEQPEREAYLSHYVFGPEMRAHYAANAKSVAGFAGPCACRRLVLDIDRADLALALADARRLVTAVVDRYPELEGDVPVYFSGNKGFHVLVPLAHRPPPAPEFPRHARAFAEAHAADANVTIDAGIYDVNRIVRLPNTRHPKTGRFKRRLEPRELFSLDAAAVLKLAESPGGHGLPAWDAVVPANLASDWDAAGRAVARHTEHRRDARRDAGPADLRAPKYFLDFLRFGVAEGERHGVLFRAAAWLTEQGAPEPLALALLTEPGRDVGLTPADVDRQIRCGVQHARRQRTADPEPADDVTDATDFPFGALAPAATPSERGPA